jgi:hypothetical protein
MPTHIFFPNELGAVSMVTPVLTCGIPIEEIARKDVPAGVPFIFVDEADLPTDYTFFNAWQGDFSNPHGYGIGPQAWFIEQYEAEIATLDPVVDAGRISQLRVAIAVQQQEMQA